MEYYDRVIQEAIATKLYCLIHQVARKCMAHLSRGTMVPAGPYISYHIKFYNNLAWLGVYPSRGVSSVSFPPGDEGKEKRQDVGRLPAAKWAEVYGALRPFLRPFGESGEGRLDFYHRSLSRLSERGKSNQM